MILIVIISLNNLDLKFLNVTIAYSTVRDDRFFLIQMMTTKARNCFKSSSGHILSQNITYRMYVQL